MFDNYVNVQKRVSKMVTSISMNSTNVQPGKFLMLQFMMGNLSQIGDSISNVVSSMNAIAKNSISNMRG
jgi:hypothetical protein